MTHPAYPKFYIQKEDRPASGPFHWKRIVEWYEFGLLDDYVVQKPNNVLAPIADLVGAYGVPPTIGIQSMLLAPSEGAAKCTQEQRTALDAQGFPQISVPLTQELADYIGKRLACSDQALEAEDPNFKSPNPLAFSAPAQELEATSNDPATSNDSADVSEPVSEASTAAEEITQDATVVKESALEVDKSAESIEEVSKGVLESSAATPTPETEAPEPIEAAPAEATPPTAMSFEKLADSTPEVQPVQNRWSDNSNSNRKRILVSLSAIAAILVVVGAVFYVSNSSSTDPGQITPVALETEAPIEMESETLSETQTETSSDLLSASATSESAVSVVASSEVEEVAESRSSEGESERAEESIPAAAATVTTDSPEEAVAASSVGKAEAVADTNPAPAEASLKADTPVEEEVRPDAVVAKVPVDAVEGATSPSTEAGAEKASTEQADQPPVADSDDLVADTEVPVSVKLSAQQVADTSTRVVARDANSSSEPSKPAGEKSAETATKQEKQSFAPAATLEEFPDYVPSF